MAEIKRLFIDMTETPLSSKQLDAITKLDADLLVMREDEPVLYSLITNLTLNSDVHGLVEAVVLYIGDRSTLGKYHETVIHLPVGSPYFMYWLSLALHKADEEDDYDSWTVVFSFYEVEGEGGEPQFQQFVFV